MALIPCPACAAQVSEAAVACPRCGHPIAGNPEVRSTGATFKDALTRPDAVRNGITVLGVFVAAPWIARIIAVLALTLVAVVALMNR